MWPGFTRPDSYVGPHGALVDEESGTDLGVAESVCHLAQDVELEGRPDHDPDRCVRGGTLGPLVPGIGLWRAGWSIGIPLALFAGVALTMADAGRWPLALAFGLTWLGMGLVARRLWADASSRGSGPRAAVESSV